MIHAKNETSELARLKNVVSSKISSCASETTEDGKRTKKGSAALSIHRRRRRSFQPTSTRLFVPSYDAHIKRALFLLYRLTTRQKSLLSIPLCTNCDDWPSPHSPPACQPTDRPSDHTIRVISSTTRCLLRVQQSTCCL